MSRVSNEVIVERIDGMKEHFNVVIETVNKNFNDFKKCFNEKTLPEIKENTKFRQQAKGIFKVIALVFSAVGVGVVWIFDKLKFWGGNING